MTALTISKPGSMTDGESLQFVLNLIRDAPTM